MLPNGAGAPRVGVKVKSDALRNFKVLIVRLVSSNIATNANPTNHVAVKPKIIADE